MNKRINKGELKRNHNLSLTDSAWTNLKLKSDYLKISVSEFIERMNDNEKFDSYDYQRIQFLLFEKITFLGSLILFTKRIIKQSGLEEEDEKNVIEYIHKSILVFTLIKYSVPEMSFNYIVPFLRWFIFCFLHYKKKNNSQKKTNFDSLDNHNILVQSFINRILIALNNLKIYSPGDYLILNLRYNGGFTRSQLSRYLYLNNYSSSSLDIGERIQNSVYNLRTYLWKSRCDELDKNFLNPDLVSDNELISDIEAYQVLCFKNKLSNNDLCEIKELILKTFYNSKLDFWINEVDYVFGVDDNIDVQEGAFHKIQEKLYQKIIEEKSIEKEIKDIDNKFKFCITQKECNEALIESLSSIASIEEEKIHEDLGLGVLPLLKDYLPVLNG